MKRTCIFQDTERMGNTTGLLEAARRLYGEEAFDTCGVFLDDPGDHFHGIFSHVVRVTEGLMDRWDARAMTGVLEKLHQQHDFDSILIPATTLGKMIAPRLARRLQAGLVSGVTDILRQKDSIEIIRPACSGRILEGIRFSGPAPVILSIRPNAFDYTPDASPGGGLQTNVSEYSAPATARSAVKQLHVEKIKQTRDIRDYEVLVSGGGGVKERFSDLYPLAAALNGTVSASRKLVDQGIAPRAIQVGQSGKTVSPKLYMALGIHGSMQHLAGLRQVDTIISVNTASHAPICSLSDIVVQGDTGEFIDRLMEKIMIHKLNNKDS